MNALVLNCCPVRAGATAFISETVASRLGAHFSVRSLCIDDYQICFCRGCRMCHATAECALDDGVRELMREFEQADIIVCVSPSYWADIPAQFKAFIDRCTPWCDTHEPHAKIPSGKLGYTVALRTGGGEAECLRIISSIEHFYGHLGIKPHGSLVMTRIASREDAEKRLDEQNDFCDKTIRDGIAKASAAD